MAVTVHDLRDRADRLLDALDVYDRFVDGWPHERGSVPTEVEAYLTQRDGRSEEHTSELQSQ